MFTIAMNALYRWRANNELGIHWPCPLLQRVHPAAQYSCFWKRMTEATNNILSTRGGGYAVWLCTGCHNGVSIMRNHEHTRNLNRLISCAKLCNTCSVLFCNLGPVQHLL